MSNVKVGILNNPINKINNYIVDILDGSKKINSNYIYGATMTTGGIIGSVPGAVAGFSTSEEGHGGRGFLVGGTVGFALGAGLTGGLTKIGKNTVSNMFGKFSDKMKKNIKETLEDHPLPVNDNDANILNEFANANDFNMFLNQNG